AHKLSLRFLTSGRTWFTTCRGAVAAQAIRGHSREGSVLYGVLRSCAAWAAAGRRYGCVRDCACGRVCAWWWVGCRAGGGYHGVDYAGWVVGDDDGVDVGGQDQAEFLGHR